MSKDKFEKTVGELIKELEMFDKNMPVVVSSDEELNTLFKGFVVCKLDVAGDDVKGDVACCFFGLTGYELNEIKDYRVGENNDNESK